MYILRNVTLELLWAKLGFKVLLEIPVYVENLWYLNLPLMWNVTGMYYIGVHLLQHCIIHYSVVSCWFCACKDLEFSFLAWSSHAKFLCCLMLNVIWARAHFPSDAACMETMNTQILSCRVHILTCTAHEVYLVYSLLKQTKSVIFWINRAMIQ